MSFKPKTSIQVKDVQDSDRGMQQPSDDKFTLNLLGLLVAIVLTISFVNPYTENVEYHDALLFMFSHYALFSAGFALAYFKMKLPKWLLIPGVIIAVFWHLPFAFALSAGTPAFRIVEESTIELAGLLVGSSVLVMRHLSKVILFAIWIIVDSVLAAIFILFPLPYSSQSLASSPFPESQFPIVGVAMAVFMNFVIGFIVYEYMKQFRRAFEVKGRL